jgi:hypothetical protein
MNWLHEQRRRKIMDDRMFNEVAREPDALDWLLMMCRQGMSIDPTRSAYDNMMSSNLLQVRDLPCTRWSL